MKSENKNKKELLAEIEELRAQLSQQTEQLASAQRDINEHNRMEEERNQLLLREQTARKEAEAATRARDEFMAMLSSELRTPLTSILSWTQILEDERLSKEAARAVEMITRNTRLQLQLVDELLDVSRIITGKINLQGRALKVSEIIASTLDTLSLAANAKSIQIKTNIEAPDAMIMGDANRLQQAFWNILINAIKFTPNNGRIEIDLAIVKNNVEIKICDNGRGIQPDQLPYIFDRFRQSETNKKEGQGFGLIAVRNLIEVHGGTVKVFSQGENSGTTFIIKLPIINQPESAVTTTPTTLTLPVLPEAPVPESRAVEQLPSLKTCQVLLVDAKPESCEKLQELLQQAGAEVTSAHTTAEAIAQLECRSFNVLVSDLNIPGEDRYYLIRQVRMRVAGNSIPAVAIISQTLADERWRSLLAGYQTNVTKPVNAKELITSVARLANSTSKAG